MGVGVGDADELLGVGGACWVAAVGAGEGLGAGGCGVCPD